MLVGSSSSVNSRARQSMADPDQPAIGYPRLCSLQGLANGAHQLTLNQGKDFRAVGESADQAARSPSSAGPMELHRALTLAHVVLYGLGVTIGAGIYVLVAAAASRAGMHAPIAFLAAGLLMGLTGLSLAELGVRMPIAAGEAAYARAAFRSERIAALVGFLCIATGPLRSHPSQTPARGTSSARSPA
jgi:amino acid permease